MHTTNNNKNKNKAFNNSKTDKYYQVSCTIIYHSLRFFKW